MASVDCTDLVEFQRFLNKLRTMEDKIIFKLNCELPTNSFREKDHSVKVCTEIQKQLTDLRQQRHKLIYNCVRENQAILNQFQNDASKETDVRTAHSNLRLLRNESTVEEIVAGQTDKALKDRCRKELLL
ncbi:Caffeine-induced death protein 2 [Aphelenchoides avenae]|nr:Caffeine-induced death protein 2 [Aphelenchus avenae]